MLVKCSVFDLLVRKVISKPVERSLCDAADMYITPGGQSHRRRPRDGRPEHVLLSIGFLNPAESNLRDTLTGHLSSSG